MIFREKCDIILLGKSHKSLEMQKNPVQDFGTRWYFSCTVYIFSANDIFRKVAENPEKSTILASIPRYLQIYIPAGPHWGGRGRKFKSCHSDQKSVKIVRFSRIFSIFSPKNGFDPPQPPETKSPKIFDHMFDHKQSESQMTRLFCSGCSLTFRSSPTKNSAPEDFSPREPFSLFTA